MTLDDSSARKGILFLLLNAPKPAVPYYYTANELTDLLKRGGVTVSLESSLVVRAFHHASPTDAVQFVARSREAIPGLCGRHHSISCRDAGLRKMDERLQRDRKRKAKPEYEEAKHDSKRARAAMRGKGDKEDRDYKYRKGKIAGIIQGCARCTKKDVTCGQCGQLGHRKTICTFDDTDDVITHNGKKERKNKSGKKKSLQPSKRKKSNNYGVLVADVDSWMPAIVRSNKRRINS